MTRSRLLPIARLGLVLAATTLAGTATAAPQAPAPETQLDRIEHKLDLVLHKLDQLQAAQTAGNRPAPLPATAKPVAASPDTASPAPAPETMAAGAVAIFHPAPKTALAAHSIPANSVGGLVYTGGTIHLADLKDRGIHYTGLTGVEWQGWLRTTETGRYELELDGSVVGGGDFANPVCIFSGWIEDRSIGTQEAFPRAGPAQPAPFSLILGAVLQPGLYKLRLWATCTPYIPSQQVSVELMEKAPSDLNMRPISGEDIVHKQSGNHPLASSRG